jgi:hypothetical protein
MSSADGRGRPTAKSQPSMLPVASLSPMTLVIWKRSRNVRFNGAPRQKRNPPGTRCRTSHDLAWASEQRKLESRSSSATRLSNASGRSRIRSNRPLAMVAMRSEGSSSSSQTSTTCATSRIRAA